MVYRDDRPTHRYQEGTSGQLCVDGPGEVAVERGSKFSEKDLVLLQLWRDLRILG